MFNELKTSEWVTLIGWVATFFFGVILTLITQWIQKKRKRVAWSVVNESNLLSEALLNDIETGFNVPLNISVNNQTVTDLSTIRIKVGNTGNAELKNITLHFKFGDDARVYVGRYIGDLGVYREKLSLQKMGDSATIGIAHINKGQSFEVEFLVGKYSIGEILVDMAEPGVELKKLTNVRLDKGLGHFALLSLGVPGVRYDPTAMQTAYLVEEVKSLRQIIAKSIKNM